MGKVIYANSLTLTPGTIAIDVNDSEIYVHALTKDSMNEAVGGEMGRRISQLERK